MAAVHLFLFDGTWEGMLSVVFKAFQLRRTSGVELVRLNAARPMFADSVTEVVTDSEAAGRVWAGLSRRLSREPLGALTVSFLSEQEDMDTPTFRFIVKIFTAAEGQLVERDFGDKDVLAVVNTARKVRYEAHRILQFVRFQKAADGTYFAMVDPIYNVLPLSVGHFTDRFADQPFILYDRRRGYGYYYDRREAKIMTMPDNLHHIMTGRLSPELMAPDERLFQRLWRTYFKATAIPERMNPRKQRQDMPVRFWRFMTEKNG